MLSYSLRSYQTRPCLGLLALSAKKRQSLNAPTSLIQKLAGKLTKTRIIQAGEGLEDRYAQMHQLYTVQDVCNRLALSRATLYRLIKSGQIEPVKIRSLTRFTEASIDRFLKANQTAAREYEVGF